MSPMIHLLFGTYDEEPTEVNLSLEVWLSTPFAFFPCPSPSFAKANCPHPLIVTAPSPISLENDALRRPLGPTHKLLTM